MSTELTASPSITIFNTGAGAVMRRLLIEPGDNLEALATRFIYDSMLNETAHPSPKEEKRLAMEDALAFLEPRMALLSEFEADFFGDTEYDRDAVRLATLCGSRIHLANDKGQASLKLAFDPAMNNTRKSIIARARILDGEAGQLGCMSPLEDPEEFSREARFIAHVHALMHTIPNMERPDEEPPEMEEFEVFVDIDYPAMRTFADLDTEIGEEMMERAAPLAAYMVDVLEPATLKVTAPVPLTLVADNDR